MADEGLHTGGFSSGLAVVLNGEGRKATLMADDGLHTGGFSSGLAVVLNGEERKDSSQRNHLISYCDDFGDQSLERTLEHIFNLPCKTISPLTCPVDVKLVCSLIRNEFFKYHGNMHTVEKYRDGVSVVDGSDPLTVDLEESSVCGDIRVIKPPLLVESHAVFSSARANACVWKGKWMYEVTLETSGVQQLGWATHSCPFTDHTGVGDADDSYAYDGKRVSKWNKDAEGYGQAWMVGDVIGCCIDLERDEILFYRNGTSLGVAFDGIRKMVPGLGYYPAISLSQGERCDLNFGARPFRYPILGFLPIQDPPLIIPSATRLLHCLVKLLKMQHTEKAKSNSIERLRRLKRFAPCEDLFQPVSWGICKELFSAIEAEVESAEYVAWGPLLSFMMDVFGQHASHDYESLDRVVDLLLDFPISRILFEHLINALSYRCKTASLILTECPYSGSYPYLALAYHILRREELMVLWWKMSDFEFTLEGFLSQKGPNKQDLQSMMPSVWWPGSCEDNSYENSMMLTTRTLSEAVNKIEEKHRELCCLVMKFIPPVVPPQLPGSVFSTFLQNTLLKSRGADRNIPPPGVSNNSVLVSLFTVILHFLSEGLPMPLGWLKMHSGTKEGGHEVGFLHRGGEQGFPVALFFNNYPHRVDIPRLGGSYSHLEKCYPVSNEQSEADVIRWEEGCMDAEETRVTHFSRQKPCCCSNYDADFSKISKIPYRYRGKGPQGHCSSIPERSAQVAAECSAGSLNNEVLADKPSTSDHSESEFGYRPVPQVRIVALDSMMSSASLKEEELLDAMLLLYHLGLAPNFKQASTFMSRQSQTIALLEETDKQIRETITGEQLKRLKEARGVYREEIIDCLRHSTWYRISLFSRWKQRGMYAVCMWIVQFLLVVSKMDSLFCYIPEFYLETLVDCFHVLRKSEPPFVPAGLFIKHGLGSFVTFLATHFNDERISSAELRDLLLQSISVLVQYKEFVAAFEGNQAATEIMPRALIAAFDNRSWIPVTNILLRFCKGSGFAASKHGESSSSIAFQKLLREACIQDEELFSAFLNRLFNTLSWAMTEFSVSIREMQEKYKVMELQQQKKCTLIFDLSCNLAWILEFCTSEMPHVFLFGAETNLRRLIELVVFMLNHLTLVADPEFFDLTLRRAGQAPEKINRSMMLAPLAGIILNLLDASSEAGGRDTDYLVGVFASMDCPDTVLCGFQYLLDFKWTGPSREDSYPSKLRQLEEFSSLLICRMEMQKVERVEQEGEINEENLCCICYACEADAKFVPCAHISCFGCITRHLLNCQRCFYCNATVLEVIQNDMGAS